MFCDYTMNIFSLKVIKIMISSGYLLYPYMNVLYLIFLSRLNFSTFFYISISSGTKSLELELLGQRLRTLLNKNK